MGRSVYDTLVEYSARGTYPFHMPGHKRNPMIDYLPVELDYTEIEGLDNLHDAHGILKSAMDRAAAFFGAEHTLYVVNGSTGGILIALAALSENQGGRLIVARNCHKAVYNGAFLNRMDVTYVYPQQYGQEGNRLLGSISPESVERLLERHGDVRGVVITSPTYDGIVSDVGAIARVCHARGVPLIVDEAHGAHFALGETYGRARGDGLCFPRSGVGQGADVVIHSLHKTLPSMTQTALLHHQGNLISWDKLRKYEGIYQTSSPSYVMMAGMDRCLEFLRERGETLLDAYFDHLAEFLEMTGSLAHLRVYARGDGARETFDKDVSKLLLFCGGLVDRTTGVECNGRWLQEVLRKEYAIQLEMAAADYGLALTSVLDSREGFLRLAQALSDIDQHLERKAEDEACESRMGAGDVFCSGAVPFVFSVHDAIGRRVVEVPLEAAEGRISNEYVYLYPPGCPIIVPGERFTREVVQSILGYLARGYDVEGMKDENKKKVEIIEG